MTTKAKTKAKPLTNFEMEQRREAYQFAVAIRLNAIEAVNHRLLELREQEGSSEAFANADEALSQAVETLAQTQDKYNEAFCRYVLAPGNRS